MSTNKKITQLDELTSTNWADDDVIAIVDISAEETKKIQLSTFRTAVTGVTTLTASTPLTVDTSTGDVTISVAISGGGTVNAVLDEDNMASNSPTALSTQQSIKAYVDSQIITVDSLSEVLALGNTTGGTDLSVSTGDDITFADSSKAIFGAGSDLQIYHDASNSIIKDAGTGILYIAATTLNVTNAAISETAATFSTAGASTLYFANASKFATTATGVDVTGTIVGDGLTLTTGATVTTVLDEDNMASNSATALATQQSIKAYVDANGDGDVVGPSSATDNAVVRFDSTTGKLIQNSGVIIDDSGNVGIGTASPTVELDIESTSPEIHLNDSDGVLGAAVTSRVIFQASGATQGVVGLGTSSGTMAVTNSQGNLLLQADTNNAQASSYVGFTVDNDEKMRIDSSGNVGIGTSSPDYELDVSGATDPRIVLQSTGTAGTDDTIFMNRIGGTSATNQIWFGDSGSAETGKLQYDHSNNAMTFYTNGGVERLRIDSSGNVGIGTSSPAQFVHISKVTSGGTTSLLVSNPNGSAGASAALKLGVTSEDDTVAKSAIIHERLNSYGRGDTYFCSNFAADTTEVTDADAVITIKGSNKNVGIGTTTPAVPLDVVGNIRSSTGILFGTDTAAANLLDDYEEGDWTPTIGTGSTVSSDAAYNAGFTAGKYTKVGRIVHCSATLRLTDKGTQSGNISILGLPFASANNIGSRATWSCWFHGAADLDLTGNTDGTIMMYQTGNTAYIQVRVKDPATAAGENVEFADISDTVYLQISGSYIAA